MKKTSCRYAETVAHIQNRKVPYRNINIQSISDKIFKNYFWIILNNIGLALFYLTYILPFQLRIRQKIVLLSSKKTNRLLNRILSLNFVMKFAVGPKNYTLYHALSYCLWKQYPGTYPITVKQLTFMHDNFISQFNTKYINWFAGDLFSWSRCRLSRKWSLSPATYIYIKVNL